MAFKREVSYGKYCVTMSQTFPFLVPCVHVGCLSFVKFVLSFLLPLMVLQGPERRNLFSSACSMETEEFCCSSQCDLIL